MLEIMYCPSCMDVYVKNNLKKDEKGIYFCPKPKCTGNLVDIDELLYQIIPALNKMGFVTIYSCQGHVSPGYSYRGYVILEYSLEKYQKLLLANKENLLLDISKEFRINDYGEVVNSIEIKLFIHALTNNPVYNTFLFLKGLYGLLANLKVIIDKGIKNDNNNSRRN